MTAVVLLLAAAIMLSPIVAIIGRMFIEALVHAVMGDIDEADELMLALLAIGGTICLFVGLIQLYGA